MTTSLASLRRRVEQLQTRFEEVQAQQLALAQPGNQTNLPTADRWPEWAALTKIKTTGTVAPFIPYLFQEELITLIHNNSNVIILKPRQVGVSETIACYLACRAATEAGFAAVIISKTGRDSIDLGRRVRFMLNSIGTYTFKYVSDSNTIISIVGGGTLHFLPSSPDSARSIPSCSVLWIDEAGFCTEAEAIYGAASPTLSMLGDAATTIISSTPDTEVNWYGQMWHEGIPTDWYSYIDAAIANPHEADRHIRALNQRLAAIDDDWVRFVIHWTQHPVYNQDPGWFEKTRKLRRIPLRRAHSEYNLKFGCTDTQLYSGDIIKRAARGHYQECGYTGRTYVMGIDPNSGGDDYFVAVVLDITKKPYSVAAMYRENGRTSPYSLSRVRQLIHDFIPKRITIERQAMGKVLSEGLQQIVPEYSIELFSTSRQSKDVITDRLLFLLESDDLIFPDGPIPQELRAFQALPSGRREAATGFNDDTVLALAFACNLAPEDEFASAIFDNL